jgi:hypothetical protein
VDHQQYWPGSLAQSVAVWRNKFSDYGKINVMEANCRS